MSGYEPFPTDAGGSRADASIDPRLGGRWRRFFALMIDWLLIAVLDFLAAVVIALSFGELDGDGAVLTWYGASVLIAVLYFPLLLRRTGRHNGQTLGKQALGVRVVTREGVPVTFWRAVRRDVLGAQLLAFVTSGLYALVDYPVGIFTDRRQTLHDRIGGTFVFRAEVEVRAAAEGPLPFDAAPFESDQWRPAPGAAVPAPAPDPVPPPRAPAPSSAAAEQPSQPWTPPRSPDLDRQRDEVNRALGR